MIAKAPSLLITDDDLLFRETLQVVFEPEGYRTLLAENGEEALEIIATREVHLVLLDMHMPRLTGLETIRRLRERRALLPCILLSAHLDEAIIEQARQEQAFSVLPKPVTRRQITGAVREALRQTYHWLGGAFPAENRT